MNIPFINGIQHAWASIKINFLGRTVTGITSIEYGLKKKTENIYGSGDEPIGRGEGAKEYDTTKLGLHQFETIGIQKSCGGDITSIPPFEIIVQYKPTLDAPMITDVIQNNQFTNNMRKASQGDTKLINVHELVTAGIKWHSL